MKTKKADLVVKIILIVVAVILVGLLVAYFMGVFKTQKQNLNKGTNKIDDVVNSALDFDVLVYDGKEVDGKSLVDIIEDYKEKDVKMSIWVETLDGTSTYYNYSYTSNNLGTAVTVTPPASKADSGYITESASFLGEVLRNKNKEIVCLKFVQQK